MIEVFVYDASKVDHGSGLKMTSGERTFAIGRIQVPKLVESTYQTVSMYSGKYDHPSLSCHYEIREL